MNKHGKILNGFPSVGNAISHIHIRKLQQCREHKEHAHSQPNVQSLYIGDFLQVGEEGSTLGSGGQDREETQGYPRGDSVHGQPEVDPGEDHHQGAGNVDLGDVVAVVSPEVDVQEYTGVVD